MYVDPNPVRSKIDEFRMLAEVAGYDVKDIIIQRRIPDSRYYIGKGKLNELKDMLDGVSYVIAYHQLKPTQSYNLTRELRVNVMDRVKLILEIFDKRAGDAEAKLQIRLAELKYMLPLVREYVRLSKRGEQIGFHGLGEYGAETYYKHVLRQIALIKRKLSIMKSMRDVHIVKRKDRGIPEIVLTGYTMAGKTTLFNALTGEAKYIDGKAFATLSTYSRLVNFNGKYAVVTDTVGFIDDLPPLLIESFYSTIREIAYADLILLLSDSSEEFSEIRRKLTSSVDILSSIGVSMSKIILVYNKIDRLSVDKNDLMRLAHNVGLGNVVFISAKDGVGLSELKAKVSSMLNDYVTVSVDVKDLDSVSRMLSGRFILTNVNDGKAILSIRRENLSVLNKINVKYLIEG